MFLIFAAMNRHASTLVPNKTEQLLVSKLRGITESLCKRILSQHHFCVQQLLSTSSSFYSDHNDDIIKLSGVRLPGQTCTWLFLLSSVQTVLEQKSIALRACGVSTGSTAVHATIMNLTELREARRQQGFVCIKSSWWCSESRVCWWGFTQRTDQRTKQIPPHIHDLALWLPARRPWQLHLI